MRIQSFMLMGIVAMSFSPSFSWAINETDFFCLPAPFGLPSVFQREVKGCGDGKSETKENVCSEGARCTYITPEIRAKSFVDPKDKTKRVSIDQLPPGYKLGYFQNLYNKDYAALKNSPLVVGDVKNGRWISSDMLCPALPNGLCPLPQDCKGDILYNSSQADYVHPDVDVTVKNSAAGASQIVQHQLEGAGNPVSPQEVQ